MYDCDFGTGETVVTSCQPARVRVVARGAQMDLLKVVLSTNPFVILRSGYPAVSNSTLVGFFYLWNYSQGSCTSAIKKSALNVIIDSKDVTLFELILFQ